MRLLHQIDTVVADQRIVTPDTVRCAVIVQPPGFTEAVGISKCDGLPLVQVAVTSCGPHVTGAVTWRFLIVNEVVEVATSVIGVARWTSVQAFSSRR